MAKIDSDIICTTYTRKSDRLTMCWDEKSDLWIVRRGPSCFLWNKVKEGWMFIGGLPSDKVFVNPGPFLMSFDEASTLLKTLPAIE
jgi:hypothetical protein